MGEIVWLGRYPVKSMLGEELAGAWLAGAGVVGDRRYALIDELTGLVASAKNPRRWGSLLRMSSRYVDGRSLDGRRVLISLGDGTRVRVDDPEADAVLSRAVGRAVRLSRSRPAGATMERWTPPTEPSPGTLTRGTLAAASPGDTFVDFAPVHLVTTATIDALAQAHPKSTVDVRRFRPNIVVRMVDPVPFVENTWVGRTVSFGRTAEVEVIVATPRCAVPTLAQGTGLAADPDVLRTAARLNRVPVFELGTLTCVGAYGSVRRPGRLRVGDRVRVTPA